MKKNVWKRKWICIFMIVLLLVLSIAGCGKKETASKGKSDRVKVEKTVQEDSKPELSEAKQSLRLFQKNLKRSHIMLAAAFLGYASDSQPFDRQQVQTLLENGGYAEAYPFLTEITEDNIVSYEGSEVFVIVPQSAGCAVAVESVEWDENWENQVKETRYKKDKAVPFVVKCNKSELIYNLMITLIKGTETFTYSPMLNLMDGTMLAENLDGESIFDFTRYGQVDISIYPVEGDEEDLEGYGDPEGYGEGPGLNGRWLSGELKDQTGRNITYGMNFGDDRYFEFQYGQMGRDTQSWVGTFEVAGINDNGEYQVNYTLNSPDGERTGEFFVEMHYEEMYVTEGSGDAIFPFTDGSSEWFYFSSY